MLTDRAALVDGERGLDLGLILTMYLSRTQGGMFLCACVPASACLHLCAERKRDVVRQELLFEAATRF